MKTQQLSRLVGLALLIFTFCLTSAAQQAAMNHFELASQARMKARLLAERENYEAALAVLNSLDAGKFEAGDAAVQAAAARVQGVYTDKGRILIKLRRYDQADAAFYQAFDANIAKAEIDLAEIRKNRPEASTSPVKAALFRSAAVSAKGALALADAVVGLRESHYLLARAPAAPFDPARLAKYNSLKETIAKASTL